MGRFVVEKEERKYSMAGEVDPSLIHLGIKKVPQWLDCGDLTN